MKDKQVKRTLEEQLQKSGGFLTTEQLKAYPGIDSNMCSIHFNFHQSIASTEKEEDDDASSLASDVGKDEADVLYQMLTEQAATFTGLNNKINKAITEHDGDMTTLFINPNTAQFYKDLGEGMRATVRELRELNVSLNGKKDGALDGLRALAQALQPTAVPATMATTEYDD